MTGYPGRGSSGRENKSRAYARRGFGVPLPDGGSIPPASILRSSTRSGESEGCPPKRLGEGGLSDVSTTARRATDGMPPELDAERRERRMPSEAS